MQGASNYLVPIVSRGSVDIYSEWREILKSLLLEQSQLTLTESLGEGERYNTQLVFEPNYTIMQTTCNVHTYLTSISEGVGTYIIVATFHMHTCNIYLHVIL